MQSTQFPVRVQAKHKIRLGHTFFRRRWIGQCYFSVTGKNCGTLRMSFGYRLESHTHPKAKLPIVKYGIRNTNGIVMQNDRNRILFGVCMDNNVIAGYCHVGPLKVCNCSQCGNRSTICKMHIGKKNLTLYLSPKATYSPIMFPSWFNTFKSTRKFHTLSSAVMHRDSRSTHRESLKARSSMRFT